MALHAELSALRSEVNELRTATLGLKTYPAVVKRNELQRKRILITGGAGFVGSHLTDKLMKVVSTLPTPPKLRIPIACNGPRVSS